MEKQRMDRRHVLFGSGLLSCGILLWYLLYPAVTMSAQIDTESGDQGRADSDSLIVEVQAVPEMPALHSPWILTFLVDHPSPSEVIIRYPPLPSALSLESIRTGARMLERPGETRRRWTAIEFWFIPQRPGAISLKPFEISTPDKRSLTAPISGYIQGTIGEYHPYFSWGTPPHSLNIGEQGELSLYLINWDPQKPLPSGDLLRRKVPEQAILEERVIAESDRKQGVALRLGIIPLGGREFTLEPVRIQHEGLTLEIPGISIPLITGEKEEPPEERSGSLLSPPETPNPSAPALPEIPVQVFPLFRSDYDKALQKIRSLWNEGHIPEALAEMRLHEREHLAGPQFAVLRREAERRLGFELARDERRRPRKLFRFLFLVSLGLLILTAIWCIRNRQFLILKQKAVTFHFPWGYKGIVVILIALMIIAAIGFSEGMLYSAPDRKTGPAILKASEAYRVPDEGGGISARFSDGQPVIIRSVSDSWMYVESFDGRIGWVPRDKVMVY